MSLNSCRSLRTEYDSFKWLTRFWVTTRVSSLAAQTRRSEIKTVRKFAPPITFLDIAKTARILTNLRSVVLTHQRTEIGTFYESSVPFNGVLHKTG